MTNGLLAIDERLLQFKHEWAVGDRLKATEIACKYSEENKLILEPIFMKYTQEDLVREIDELRKTPGRENDVIVVEMWLLAMYSPINVSGEVNVRLDLALAKALIRATSTDKTIGGE